MHIEPKQLPEVRSEIVDFYEDPLIREQQMQNLSFLSTTDWPFTPEDQYKLELAAAKTGRLYYATSNMCELAQHAAESLDVLSVLPEHIPSMSGIMYFESPKAAITLRQPTVRYGVCAIEWGVMYNHLVTIPLISSKAQLDTLAEAGRIYGKELHYNRLRQPPLINTGGYDMYLMPLGNLAASEFEPSDANSDAFRIAKLLVTACLLMQQQGISESETVQAPRSAQKRIRRAGHSLDPVRVVTLGKRHRPTQQNTEEKTQREYDHRWIVNGHWRNQAYGPERKLRRPKWIAPYVKGPEDKPLVVREKVTLWK